jgi:glutathione S-transferase
MALELVIGNKAYSSWSLRAWLALRATGAPFAERRISLYTPESRARLAELSPSGRVPVLLDGDLVVWDSLAICEYLAERFPGRGLWPQDARERAHARAISAEMHSGFAALRSALPMNVRATGRRVAYDADVQSDIRRICAIWRDCRARHEGAGPWLFGTFTIADAMYAPVATRFHTYGVDCDPVAQAYVATVLGSADVRAWIEDAQREKEVVAASEVGA